MWNRDDDNKKPLKAPENRTGSGRPALIGSSIALRGELVGREDLTIDGTFEGEIEVSGCLVTIGATGQIEGEVRAKVIAVEGQVTGNLIAEDQVVVRASGRMQGDIQAPRVALDEGCQFKGNIDMEPGKEKSAKDEKGDAKASPGGGGQPQGSKPDSDDAKKDSDGGGDGKPGNGGSSGSGSGSGSGGGNPPPKHSQNPGSNKGR